MRQSRRILLIGAENHYGREITRGVNAYARLHGHWEYQFGRDNSLETVKRARAAIKQWKANGIIALIQTDRVERFVRESGVPAVNVTASRELKFPGVVADNVAIGRMAARHFLERGYRHFGFCAVTPELATVRRCKGFLEEINKAGHECHVFREHYRGRTDGQWGRNHWRMGRWLTSLKKPVAIMSVYDLRGQEMLGVCERLGLAVPEQVSIVGVGNDDIVCVTSNPNLSSVDPDIQRIGFEAAKLLDEMLRGKLPPRTPTLIPPLRVATRRSSDAVAVEDPQIGAALKFIREHSHEAISVKELLREVPICRKTMEKRFEKILGNTPKGVITQARVEKAKIMLAETGLSIKALASKLGFADSRKFASFCRRQMGMTPSEYRRRLQLDGGGVRAR